MNTTNNDTRNWQVSLSDPAALVEGIDDVAQCIYIILTTIPGSDPLRPEFGSNVYQYLDRPLDDIRTKIIYAATTAIERWEKRIDVTRCTVSRAAFDRIVVKIEGAMTASAAPATITVTL